MSGAGALAGLRCLFQRDLTLALRRRSDTVAALVFFMIVVSLFPLGVGPEPALLRSMAPGVVWVAALLASMLSLGRLFADDFADGTLEQRRGRQQQLLQRAVLVVVGEQARQ